MPATRNSQTFKLGKVPPSALLRSVFPYLGKKTQNVLVRPGIGRDAAIIKYRGRVLVFSTDPITGTPTHIGAHSVIINANDVATTGAKPTWYLCTLLLPLGTRESSLRQVMMEIDQAAGELGIAVVGGHTEVTWGLSRPIIAGFMMGETDTNRVLSTEGGRPGDIILLTKSAGLEGTAIVASDYSERLGKMAPELLRKAKNFFKEISVVREALLIAGLKSVHALHDPTEGGVLNGIWEIAEASKLGVEVWADRIPVALETREICSLLKLDPLKLMGSGSLLAAVQPTGVQTVAGKLRKMGLRVSEVGKLTSRAEGRHLRKGQNTTSLEAVPRDELYKLA